ncbi:MAG: HAD family hydrolase [Gammaproteobacteria bacterium]|nr:HAD family hydrolase [Gammaproteobacteria bacterium]
MNIDEKVIERAKSIRLALFDVDGVFTDGNIHIDSQGKEIKTFNTLDGHGIRLLQHYGIQVGVITGRRSEALDHRMRDLDIEHLYQGSIDKYAVFQQLLSKLNLAPEQASFAGDDIVDLQVMSHCGLAIAVANAHDFVKKHAHWETSATGGQGAVREICELLLESQGLLQEAFTYNLRKP